MGPAERLGSDLKERAHAPGCRKTSTGSQAPSIVPEEWSRDTFRATVPGPLACLTLAFKRPVAPGQYEVKPSCSTSTPMGEWPSRNVVTVPGSVKVLGQK